MNKFFAKETTPITSEKWRSDNELNRIELLSKELKKNNIYKDFEVVSAPSNGQIVLKIEKTIPANERGLLLLNLEENLSQENNLDIQELELNEDLDLSDDNTIEEELDLDTEELELIDESSDESESDTYESDEISDLDENIEEVYLDDDFCLLLMCGHSHGGFEKPKKRAQPPGDVSAFLYENGLKESLFVASFLVFARQLQQKYCPRYTESPTPLAHCKQLLARHR